VHKCLYTTVSRYDPAKYTQFMALPSSCRPPGRFLTFRYPPAKLTMSNEREARLKREFAKFYPGLRPGIWYKAAWLSARQFARMPCDGRVSSIARVVNETHFDFRGGRPRNQRGAGQTT
jgi:hypothetical protein